MLVLLIILLVIALLNCIEIETHLENTFWIEKSTNKRIKIISDNANEGILFRYVDEEGLKTCSIITLLKLFKYDGTE